MLCYVSRGIRQQEVGLKIDAESTLHVLGIPEVEGDWWIRKSFKLLKETQKIPNFLHCTWHQYNKFIYQ